MIDSKTKLIGILGYPLGHSLSPIMHNSTLQKMKLNYAYIPLEVKPNKIEQVIKAITALNLIGVNVTIPFKEKVIEYIDELSPEAKACKAVNLIKNESGKLIGFNTDGSGFVAALKEKDISVNGKVVLIGAGGAARAVGYALATNGAKAITFLDLDQTKAKNLADFISQKSQINCYGFEMNREVFMNVGSFADLIVNCTPVGMYPNIDVSPVDNLDMIKEDAIVCDLIYNPLETKFLSMAKARGLITMNGVPMFVHQGALTLKILTGESPPVAFMKEVVHYQMQQ